MSYENFVVTFNRKTPRTYEEAYQTAEYCNAIEMPRREEHSMLKTISVMLIGTILTCCFFYVLPSKADNYDLKGKPLYNKTVEAISQKYKRDPVQVVHIVHTAVEVSEQKGIDPVLTLAVIATESEFNPKAYNKSSGASGLTQVLAGMHAKLIKSYQGSIFDPLVAINVGTDLMKTYISWWGGNTKKGISQYGGDFSGAYYQKVMYNYKWIDKTVERDI